MSSQVVIYLDEIQLFLWWVKEGVQQTNHMWVLQMGQNPVNTSRAILLL